MRVACALLALLIVGAAAQDYTHIVRILMRSSSFICACAVGPFLGSPNPERPVCVLSLSAASIFISLFASNLG